jgi:ferredoxin-NADP reductase
VRPAGRLTAADLVPLWEPGQTAYVCGSAGFAEAASQLLVDLGVPAPDIRVERFGASG